MSDDEFALVQSVLHRIDGVIQPRALAACVALTVLAAYGPTAVTTATKQLWHNANVPEEDCLDLIAAEQAREALLQAHIALGVPRYVQRSVWQA